MFPLFSDYGVFVMIIDISILVCIGDPHTKWVEASAWVCVPRRGGSLGR